MKVQDFVSEALKQKIGQERLYCTICDFEAKTIGEIDNHWKEKHSTANKDLFHYTYANLNGEQKRE